MKKMQVELKYNPYNLKENGVFLENGVELINVFPTCMKNKRLQEWALPCKYMKYNWSGIFQSISHEIGRQQFDVKFKGREVDYKDLLYAMKILPKEYQISIVYENAGEYNEKIEQLNELIKKINASPIQNIQERFKDALDEVLNKEFKVGVFGNMSSGKSTFINALVGAKVLETSTDECTKKVVKIYNIDESEQFQIKYINNENREEIIIPEEEITKELLHELNSCDKCEDIRIYGNVDFIKNDICNLVFIDTPGVGSRNRENADKAYKELNGLNCIKIIVFDAAQIEMEDTKKIIENVANEIKGELGNSSGNVFFIINRMDELIDSDDDPQNKIDKVKRILDEVGIKHIKIFPMYSLGAYVTKCTIHDRKMLPGENDRYNSLIRWTEDKNYEKYNMHQYRPKKNEEDDKKFYEKLSLNEKALYFTGIKAIEEEIIECINKFAFPIKIEAFYRRYLKLFQYESECDNWLKEKLCSIQKKNDSLSISQQKKEEGEALKEKAERAVKLRERIEEAKRDNEKELNDLRKYIQNNKIEILNEIRDILASNTSVKGDCGEIISTIVGGVMPGGLVTTFAGGVVGGIIKGAVNSKENEKCNAKINEGELLLLKEHLLSIEELLKKSLTEIQEMAKGTLKDLNICVPSLQPVTFPEIEINIDVEECRKFAFLGENIDNNKVENLLDKELDKELEKLAGEYERQSKELFEDLESPVKSAENILKRAKRNIADVTGEINDLNGELNKLNAEIELLDALKADIEKIIKI